MEITDGINESGKVQFSAIRLITILLFICFSGCLLVLCPALKTFAQKKKTPSKPAFKYVDFPHSKHKLECNSCHKFPSPNWEKVRKSEEAFPDITDYPTHDACLKCHRPQFFRSLKPTICSICHTNPSPRDSGRHPFPNPREIFDRSPKGQVAVSDFAVSFPHDKHIEIVSQYKTPFDKNSDAGNLFVSVRMKRSDAGEKSCAVCHQTYQPQGDSEDEYLTKPPEKLGDSFWLKKGTFKTTPIGHTVCFTCHSIDTGILPAPSDCATCHKLKPKETTTDFAPQAAAQMGITDKIMLMAWRKRDSSATFRHEWSSHAELECGNCHNVKAINTLDAATKKVNVLSCAICHITATADDGGVLNFEVDSRKKNPKFQCVKCHLAYGALPVPESHIKAIAEQAGN